ncbi:MAG: MarC family protein, partial [Casimicrobiaceae bacterium]
MPDLAITTDLRNFVVAFALVVGGLLPIVNPVGSAPMFLAMTAGSSRKARQQLALQIAINSFLLLMGSLIFGAFVLKLFGLSVPVVQVAG